MEIFSQNVRCVLKGDTSDMCQKAVGLLPSCILVASVFSHGFSVSVASMRKHTVSLFTARRKKRKQKEGVVMKQCMPSTENYFLLYKQQFVTSPVVTVAAHALQKCTYDPCLRKETPGLRFQFNIWLHFLCAMHDVTRPVVFLEWLQVIRI